MKGQKKEILDIEGGKMNKQEADIEAKKYFRKLLKKLMKLSHRLRKMESGRWDLIQIGNFLRNWIGKLRRNLKHWHL